MLTENLYFKIVAIPNVITWHLQRKLKKLKKTKQVIFGDNLDLLNV